VEMVQQADPPDAATIKVAGQTIEVSISKAS